MVLVLFNLLSQSLFCFFLSHKVSCLYPLYCFFSSIDLFVSLLSSQGFHTPPVLFKIRGLIFVRDLWAYRHPFFEAYAIQNSWLAVLNPWLIIYRLVKKKKEGEEFKLFFVCFGSLSDHRESRISFSELESDYCCSESGFDCN